MPLDIELPLSIHQINLVSTYKTKNEEPQKVLKVDVTAENNVEFTYLEILHDKVEYTHSISIDMYEFVVLQKMLKVIFELI